VCHPARRGGGRPTPIRHLCSEAGKGSFGLVALGTSVGLARGGLPQKNPKNQKISIFRFQSNNHIMREERGGGRSARRLCQGQRSRVPSALLERSAVVNGREYRCTVAVGYEVLGDGRQMVARERYSHAIALKAAPCGPRTIGGAVSRTVRNRAALEHTTRRRSLEAKTRPQRRCLGAGKEWRKNGLRPRGRLDGSTVDAAVTGRRGDCDHRHAKTIEPPPPSPPRRVPEHLTGAVSGVPRVSAGCAPRRRTEQEGRRQQRRSHWQPGVAAAGHRRAGLARRDLEDASRRYGHAVHTREALVVFGTSSSSREG